MQAMTENEIIEKLAQNSQVFSALLSNVSEPEFLWKPEKNRWCLLEIICHLYDEEHEDFRARTQHVLETPNAALPPINPNAWVTERAYLAQNFNDKLAAFLQERQTSVAWLKKLEWPKWDNAFMHAEYGPMSARMFLTNWLAHDLLHIKQITKLKYDYVTHNTQEVLLYAGSW